MRDRPHPTHFTVDEALEVVARLAPERAYFTHICHDLPHAATCARLPPGVELAYDGLVLDIVTMTRSPLRASAHPAFSSASRIRSALSSASVGEARRPPAFAASAGEQYVLSVTA